MPNYSFPLNENSSGCKTGLVDGHYKKGDVCVGVRSRLIYEWEAEAETQTEN